jgi:hypothetical protein
LLTVDYSPEKVIVVVPTTEEVEVLPIPASNSNSSLFESYFPKVEKLEKPETT